MAGRRLAILFLSALGLNGGDIAKRMGLSDSTISITLAEWLGPNWRRQAKQARPHPAKRRREPPKIHEQRDAQIGALRNERQTYQYIGNIFGVSRQRVQQIIKRKRKEHDNTETT